MRTLDLHDYNLEDAYQKSQEFIAEAYKDHIKKLFYYLDVVEIETKIKDQRWAK